MLLHGGSFNGAQLLKPETVAEMHRNHDRQYPVRHPQDRDAGALERRRPLPWRADPLGTRLHAECRSRGPNGRSAGTVSWGGIFNTYYWLDPARKVTGLIMTQILPFADPRVLKLYGQFESACTRR